MSEAAFQKLNVLPMDEYNRKLISYVHPPDWVNPTPADCYDLVVIGAGTGGLVAAAGSAGLKVGLKVALIEKHLMGGDCLNLGCVPSKCMIRSSRVVSELWNSESFGIRQKDDFEVDFSAVMERMRRLRAEISPHDAVERFDKMGIDIFLGEASFQAQGMIVVGDKQLRYKKAVIATGARARDLSIEGLSEAGFLTNETVFSLTQRPSRLAVIGGGPIGCELAQVFRRLGSEVVLLHKSDHILNKEDADAAELVQKRFEHEGVRLILNAEIQRVEKTEAGKTLYYTTPQGEDRVMVDDILVGVGRAPNVETLNLEAVGVQYDLHHGVEINDYLQTSNPKIYAVGDVAMKQKFTHAADAAARIVIKNALFTPFGIGRDKLSDLVMPWVTYTDPEIAHVGLYEHQAKEKGIATNTIMIAFDDVDRAIADGETEGFLKILHKKGSDEILGATIVARHAGEMISEVTTAIVNKVGLNGLSKVIHPYPTQAECIKKAADAYRQTILSSKLRTILRFLHRFS